MTKEELYKAAEEGFNKHCAEDYCDPSKPDLELYKDGYKDGTTNICVKILEEIGNMSLTAVSPNILRSIFRKLGVEV